MKKERTDIVEKKERTDIVECSECEQPIRMNKDEFISIGESSKIYCKGHLLKYNSKDDHLSDKEKLVIVTALAQYNRKEYWDMKFKSFLTKLEKKFR